MLNIIISFLTFVLILISLFMVLVILMQKGSSGGGMGSAFGGGVAESTFGAETTNILTRATKWAAFGFFIVALTLYLLYMAREHGAVEEVDTDLPDIPVERAEPAAEGATPAASPEAPAPEEDADEAPPKPQE
ncbi:MAG: preprotein translocase subunit SecG [Verrucomicrobia bacterium]|jgi:preprotein translocase subunit SecG|nr:preprotein translocase subunit SecG [Verrucomicrobiota bacterium]